MVFPTDNKERFYNQTAPFFCSAFLVNERLVVSAGHCAPWCSGGAFVFGYQLSGPFDSGATVIPADNVYFCKKIVASRNNDDADWAVFEVGISFLLIISS